MYLAVSNVAGKTTGLSEQVRITALSHTRLLWNVQR